MRRTIGPALGAAAILGATLAVGPQAALGADAAISCSDVSPQETLTVAMDGDIETIDPMFSHFQKANEVNYNVEDQFFRYGTAPAEAYGHGDVRHDRHPGLVRRIAGRWNRRRPVDHAGHPRRA